MLGFSTTHSFRDVLKDKRGSVATELTGLALVMVAIGALGTAMTTDVGAVTSVATKAERQAYVTSIVGDPHKRSTWGTPSSPRTDDVTLPNGHTIKVTTWKESTPVSTQLTAVAPTTSGPDAANCTTPAAAKKQGCIYATRIHAGDLDSLQPHAIVKKDVTTAAGAVVGTVDSRVGSSTPIPQDVTFASGSDSGASVWRYLINARSSDASGEIRIKQGARTLAVIPVDSAANNYFGTFTAQLAGPSVAPVTATVTGGDVVVKTVFMYRAGSTE